MNVFRDTINSMREHKSRQCHQNNRREKGRNDAEVMAVQSKKVNNGAPTKMMSAVDLKIRNSVGNQGVPEDLRNQRLHVSSPQPVW